MARSVWKLARLLSALAFAATTLSTQTHLALAGPGHAGDEGHAHGTASSSSAQSPRVIATSEQFQLVGILKSGKLTIYLDREPDNVPVTDAKIAVSVAGKSVPVTATKDGTYELPADDFAKPGDHEFQFTIAAAGKTDLLAGVLTIVGAQGAAAAAKPHGQLHLAGVLGRLRQLPMWFSALAIFGIGLLAGLLLGGSRRRVAAAVVALTAIASSFAFTSITALAGPGHAGDEGHAHGPEQGAGLSDAASRLPDGSVFLPKPTQRLLAVRTRLVEQGEAGRVVALPGRVNQGANNVIVIEVALYDQLGSDAIKAAHAIGPGGVNAALTLANRAGELRNNATILHFAVPASAPAALKASGQRVSVMVDTGEPIRGVVLSRAAIVTAPNGQSVVFEHSEPERFTPKLVLFTSIDPDRVVVTSGLSAGDKIVVEAASLINQVR